jgi:hypothetical protein
MRTWPILLQVQHSIAAPPRVFWLCFGLVVATVGALSPVLSGGFVNYDDDIYVTQNLAVLEGISFNSIEWAFAATVSNHWHPLTWISLQIDVECYGTAAAGFHFTNLLLHTASVLLLFLLLRRMTGQDWMSAVAAALFAIHPLHVESVAWVTERKDVLSTLFLFLALHAYVNFAQARARPAVGAPLALKVWPGLKSYLALTAFFVLGLLAKPMLITLPGILLLLDFWPLGRVSWARSPIQCNGGKQWTSHPLARLMAEKIPLLAISIASGAVSLYAQKHGGGLKSGSYLAADDRIGYALLAYTGYLAKMLWPANLAVAYPLRRESIPAFEMGISASILLVITVAVLWFARSRPYLAVGWLWYVLTLLPVSGVVQLGSYAMADRYTYVPLIGVFIAVVWGLGDCCRSNAAKRVLSFAAAIVLLTFMGLSWRQAGY